MTKSEKRIFGISFVFGGVITAAYLLAPEETSRVLNAAHKVLGKKSSSSNFKYSEAEDVEFVMVENPKSDKGATQSV